MGPARHPLRAAAAIAVCALAACGGASARQAAGTAAAPARATADPCAAPARAGDRTLDAGRTILHVARGARTGRRLPLVLAFHGLHSDGAQTAAYTGLSREADRRGFAVAYPTAADGSWALGSPAAVTADVRLAGKVIDAATREACIDPQRVFATGISNGGRMAAVLGCRLAGRLRAIAPVSGGLRRLPDCRPPRPLSVLVIHGTADTAAPYRGRDGEGAVLPFARGWARRDGCAATPARARPARRVLRLAWRGCAGGVRVTHLRVEGGGHGWAPSAANGADLDASAATWRFFAATG